MQKYSSVVPRYSLLSLLTAPVAQNVTARSSRFSPTKRFFCVEL